MWIKMKKWSIAFIMISMLVFSMAGCSQTSKKQPEDILYENGLKIINTMDEMVHSEYYQYFTAPTAEMQNIIEKMANGDYSTPKAVYRISCGW